MKKEINVTISDGSAGHNLARSVSTHYTYRGIAIEVSQHGSMVPEYSDEPITCAYMTLFVGRNLQIGELNPVGPSYGDGSENSLEAALDDAGEFHGGVSYYRYSINCETGWHRSTYPVVKVGCDYNHLHDTPTPPNEAVQDMCAVIDRLYAAGFLRLPQC